MGEGGGNTDAEESGRKVCKNVCPTLPDYTLALSIEAQ